MNIDIVTVMVMTGVVVTTVGVVFISDVLRRHAEGAGHLWALSFLAGMLSIVCYTAWGSVPDAWWTLALGNAAFAAVPGVLWLGARRYNGHSVVAPSIVVVAGASATALAVPFANNPTSTWAGIEVMFAVSAAFAWLTAMSARRTPLNSSPAAMGLSVVMLLGGLYYSARLVTFLMIGPGHAAFDVPFGVQSASIFSCITVIVTSNLLSVILAEQRPLVRARSAQLLELSDDGVFDAPSFTALLTDTVARVADRRESAAVISVRLDDLNRIATAFGATEAEELNRIWRRSTRGASPTEAMIGVDPEGGLLVLLPHAASGRARASAIRVRRAVHDAVMAAQMSVVPTVRVGVAVMEGTWRAPADLVAAARAEADADRNA